MVPRLANTGLHAHHGWCPNTRHLGPHPFEYSPDTPVPDARLADHLVWAPDARKARGKRYSLSGMLLVAVSEALAGCRGFTATGEWAARLAPAALDEFGLRAAHSGSTLRKLFTRIDATVLVVPLRVV